MYGRTEKNSSDSRENCPKEAPSEAFTGDCSAVNDWWREGRGGEEVFLFHVITKSSFPPNLFEI